MTKDTKPRKCEICGYKAKKSTEVVQKCEDEIWRCHVCREKAMFGKFESMREMLENDFKSRKKLDKWKDYINELQEKN